MDFIINKNQSQLIPGIKDVKSIISCDDQYYPSLIMIHSSWYYYNWAVEGGLDSSFNIYPNIVDKLLYCFYHKILILNKDDMS